MDKGYGWIKDIAQVHGIPIPDLLALARTNDPYFCGSPANIAQAQWFAGWFERLGCGCGVHLRRIHYQLVSQREAVVRHDGKPYENTEKSWSYLTVAAKHARTLELVDVRDFVDQRNPDPRIIRPSRFGDDEPRTFFCEHRALSIHGIYPLPTAPDFELPEPELCGYDYSGADQPCLMEVWVEKSTVTDVLEPICRQYGMNLVISAGFQSITAAVNLIQRAIAAQRPARIFYVSDFDPAGDRMPVAVARQIEYWSSDFPEVPDIALTPLALTREQVDQYRLPRIPIKETDMRRERFEATHGEGAVELDALQALHPGTLAALVSQAAQEFFDPDLEDRADEVADEALDAVAEQWKQETEDERKALEDLSKRTAAVYARYERRLGFVRKSMDRELEPLRKALEGIAAALADKQRDFDPDLPERAVSDIEPDVSDWLFHSDRDYFEQLAAYRREAA